MARKDLSVILFWQGGGPSQLDMWDMKPDAPSEFRGVFNPINTKLDGLQICEHMPRIAKIADKITLHPLGHARRLRSRIRHAHAAHRLQADERHSGERSAGYGSIVAKEMGPRADGFPAYVSVPTAPKSSAAAYLGVAYNPFETQGDPNSDNFNVQQPEDPRRPDAGASAKIAAHSSSISTRCAATSMPPA